MIFFPWYPAMMLAFEAQHVIDIRLQKMKTLSAADAGAEVKLMISEKVTAATETTAIIMFGGSPSSVISHYRKVVAANANRLESSVPAKKSSKVGGVLEHA